LSQGKQKGLVWLAAAENGAIPGGKVGGVGDVLRDLPDALAGLGWDVRVVTPAYGMFHRLPGAQLQDHVGLRFGGHPRVARVYSLPRRAAGPVDYVIKHPLMTPGQPGRIYHADAPDQPFATDAGKFAFFCAALAAWLGRCDRPPDVLHLHDWHTGLAPLLLQRVGRPRIVFTIHNLAYQGIRPLSGHSSSLQQWFPELEYEHAEVADPRYSDCVNFMATAIRLADGISTVSPSYAREILRPSDPAHGFSGGEGLESDLAKADAAGRLRGILNGCFYPGERPATPAWGEVLAAIRSEAVLLSRNPALARQLEGDRPAVVALSIGRVVDQKVSLFLEPAAGHATALEAICQSLGENGLFIMLGNGDLALEERLLQIAARQPNFMFLCGYAEALSALLYRAGDLFLMPSSFEPCGISQMLALRAGQPCVVHDVGGLRDTVEDGVTGFVFGGSSPSRQATAFCSAVRRALHLQRTHTAAWERMRKAAASRRFDWRRAAVDYQSGLYGHGDPA